MCAWALLTVYIGLFSCIGNTVAGWLPNIGLQFMHWALLNVYRALLNVYRALLSL